MAASGSKRKRVSLTAPLLLGGGLAGAAVLTWLHMPAGALMGAVAGSLTVNMMMAVIAQRRHPEGKMAPRERFPAPVRLVGQVLIGVLAGAQLDQHILNVLLHALLPVVLAVVLLIATSFLLARYLFSKNGIDPYTAVMSAAPGGISELAAVAEERGAAMHVVLLIHLFRVLVVVLIVLPLVMLIVGGAS